MEEIIKQDSTLVLMYPSILTKKREFELLLKTRNVCVIPTSYSFNIKLLLLNKNDGIHKEGAIKKGAAIKLSARYRTITNKKKLFPYYSVPLSLMYSIDSKQLQFSKFIISYISKESIKPTKKLSFQHAIVNFLLSNNKGVNLHRIQIENIKNMKKWLNLDYGIHQIERIKNLLPRDVSLIDISPVVFKEMMLIYYIRHYEKRFNTLVFLNETQEVLDHIKSKAKLIGLGYNPDNDIYFWEDDNLAKLFVDRTAHLWENTKRIY